MLYIILDVSALNSAIVVRRLQNPFVFMEPQTKKSQEVRSCDLAGHGIGPALPIHLFETFMTQTAWLGWHSAVAPCPAEKSSIEGNGGNMGAQKSEASFCMTPWSQTHYRESKAQ